MKLNSKTCLIYSPGGHFFELQKCIEGLILTNCYHVTFESKRNTKIKNLYVIEHPNKSIIKTIINLFQSIRILIKEKPKFIITTGADVAVPTFLVGKILFNTKNIFIESIGNFDRPTLTGRICYYFSDIFLIQFKKLKKIYPKAILAKGLIH